MDTAKQSFKNVDEYIATFPEDVQVVLQQLRQTIHDAVPDAVEAISYQMPTFKLNGNLIHFAAFKDHYGLYPTPSGIDAFQQELAPYSVAKGSIRFPKNQPIPFDLVTRIVQYRVQEMRQKGKGK